MNKTPFTYQRWFLRFFCAGVILFFAVLALLGLAELTKTTHKFFWLACCLLWVIICSVITPFYFKLTKHSKLFICEGNYWVEDGTVFIETRKKTYSINNVASIYGKTVSFDEHCKSGKLIIDYNNKTLTLTSLDEKKIESFSDSGLYGLFETIRENNPELEKGEFTHFWYCLKK